MAYRLIAEDPRPVRVLTLPFGLKDGLPSGNYSASSQFYQTMHEKRLVGGYISRLPHDSIARYRGNSTLRVLMRMSESTSRAGCYQSAVSRAPAAPWIARLQIGYVVIDLNRCSPELIAFAKKACSTSPVASAEGLELYRTPVAPAIQLRQRRSRRTLAHAAFSDPLPWARRTISDRSRAALVSHHRSRPRRRHRGADDTPIRLARLDLPASLAGASVLDIGAWDGFFSFEAERRGAARVVAADYYRWHGGGWGSKAGFERANRARVEGRRRRHRRHGSRPIASACSMSCSSSACCVSPAAPAARARAHRGVTRKLLILETVVDMVGFMPGRSFYPGVSSTTIRPTGGAQRAGTARDAARRRLRRREDRVRPAARDASRGAPSRRPARQEPHRPRVPSGSRPCTLSKRSSRSSSNGHRVRPRTFLLTPGTSVRGSIMCTHGVAA